MASQQVTDKEGAGERPDGRRASYRIPDDFEVEMAGDYVDECTDLIREAEAAVLELESNPGDPELINTIFRMFHTIKGTSEFMGLLPVSGFTHKAESLLDLVREGKLEFTENSADLTLEAVDIIRYYLRIVETARGGEELPVPPGQPAVEAIIDRVTQEGISIAVVRQDLSRSAGDARTEAIQREYSRDETADEGSTVRVNLHRLDRLVDLAGELVISQTSIARDPAVESNPELIDKIARAGSTLRELQDVTLELRMIPLKATFQKMSRIVRDLTKTSGKSVQFETRGEETEIDRNMVNQLTDPLIHIIRNAIDHGVEDLRERELAGKPSIAEIRMQAFQEGGKVVIDVSDDGRGIDTSRVYDKAVEKGVVEPGTALQEEEIHRLIFSPGITSAEKVTGLSGRGVGMDVVKQAVEQMQGSVRVHSEKGRGTRFSLEIPCTMAVTNGLMVLVGSQMYIIPSLQIEQVSRAGLNRELPPDGKVEMVQIAGNRVPLVRLQQLFHIQESTVSEREEIVVKIRSKRGSFAILVDQVIGQQQIIGKPIQTPFSLEYISGGAVLGDGRIGLLLDTHSLVNRITDEILPTAGHLRGLKPVESAVY